MPRDVASRAVKREVDAGRGVGPLKNGVYLDFADAIDRLGADVIEERYGNLFEMYERITDEDPYEVPMRIYPAVHYTMGGLWVDYNLMSNVPGLYVLGEANFSDHGANRLGASARSCRASPTATSCCRHTIGDYLAPLLGSRPGADRRPRVPGGRGATSTTRCDRLLSVNGTRSVDHFHRELGKIMWDNCGMARSRGEPREGARRDPGAARGVLDATSACSASTRRSTSRSRRPAASPTSSSSASCSCRDALHREESCGGHFRVEHQTEDGEALRDDDHFAYVAAWEFTGVGRQPELHKEQLEFEYVHLAQRSYK